MEKMIFYNLAAFQKKFVQSMLIKRRISNVWILCRFIWWDEIKIGKSPFHIQCCFGMKTVKNSSESAKELFQSFVCVCVSKVLTLANFHCNHSLKPRRTSSVGHNASTCVGWHAENENFHALRKKEKLSEKNSIQHSAENSAIRKKTFFSLLKFPSFFSTHRKKSELSARECLTRTKT